MKFIILFSLVFSSSLVACVQLRSQTESLAQITSMIEDIENTPTGDMIMSFAEVFVALDQGLSELVKEIKNLRKDLDNQQNKENSLFQSQTTNHNNRVDQLEAEITSAKEEISSSQSNLQNVLLPTKENLENTIATLKENINNNENSQQTETNQRQQENASYKQRQLDHQIAREALKEAINLVKTLLNEKQTSFLQISSVKQTIYQLQYTILGQNSEYTPFIQALLSLSKNFSDQGAVLKVITILKKCLENVNKSDEQEDSKEEAALKEYEKRMNSLQKELNSLKTTLALREEDLKVTIEKITVEEKKIAQRKSDLKKLKGQLKEEYENYEKLKQAHINLIAKLDQEIGTCEKALKILGNLNVREYLVKRMNGEK